MCISDIGEIELSGMHFFARHGVLESERKDGNEFVVDFKAEFNPVAGARTDCLADTVDYSKIYDLVRRQMDIPSNLLENVACRILSAIREAFPELGAISIKVSKRNPPVDGRVEWSSITVKG